LLKTMKIPTQTGNVQSYPYNEKRL